MALPGGGVEIRGDTSKSAWLPTRAPASGALILTTRKERPFPAVISWWMVGLGTVVAVVAGLGKLNDPWGDLVNYFRDFSVNQVKYNLVATAVNDLAAGEALAAADA